MYRSRSPVYRTEVAEGFEAVCAEEIQKVMDPALPPTPWCVEFYVYFPDSRKRDIDNVVKAGLDGVTRALHVDDSNVDEIHAYKRKDKDHPRCEVIIRTVSHE